MARPDPRPAARIRGDVGPISRKMLAATFCYGGCGERPTEAHHVLFRSRGGDDLPENIAPLCRECHVHMHRDYTAWGDGVRREIGRSIRVHDPAVMDYILRKLGTGGGQVYLRQHYFVGPSRQLLRQLTAQGVPRHVGVTDE